MPSLTKAAAMAAIIAFCNAIPVPVQHMHQNKDVEHQLYRVVSGTGFVDSTAYDLASAKDDVRQLYPPFGRFSSNTAYDGASSKQLYDYEDEFPAVATTYDQLSAKDALRQLYSSFNFGEIATKHNQASGKHRAGRQLYKDTPLPFPETATAYDQASAKDNVKQIYPEFPFGGPVRVAAYDQASAKDDVKQLYFNPAEDFGIHAAYDRTSARDDVRQLYPPFGRFSSETAYDQPSGRGH